MRVVDANVLLYAVNQDAPNHEPAREWLDRALAGEDTVGFSWLVLLAFARIATRPEIFHAPMSASDAFTQIDDWISAPGGRVLHPGERHLGILAELTAAFGAGGNILNDAHLAALAVEHRADVVTYDNDFARFSRVRWRTPDQLLV